MIGVSGESQGSAMLFEQVERSHVGSRKVNEDALLARQDIGLWAVADGVGGHAAGDVASALVVGKLNQAVAGPAVASRRRAAQTAIEEANAAIWRMACEQARTIGSTIVTLAVGEGGYSCLWAGDSRAYLLRDGGLRQLTRDHSLVQKLVDSGDLGAEEALHHPNANVITRAVGSAPSLELDSVEGDVRAGDHFVLASDGLTRLLREDELAAAQKALDLERLADSWVDAALARGAPDNLSFVIVRVKAAA
jgi:serine/threonine protein phosphatase PrpC